MTRTTPPSRWARRAQSEPQHAEAKVVRVRGVGGSFEKEEAEGWGMYEAGGGVDAAARDHRRPLESVLRVWSSSWCWWKEDLIAVMATSFSRNGGPHIELDELKARDAI
ncbi:hypothetical protein B0H11DRAFT_1933821 [Mycena galericulata]|nr:hypothetical protein B0H11DRAFT_1933821 [Mycena galericulata]